MIEHQRGRGVGSTILERLIEGATARRLPGLSLSVQLGNPGIHLYERWGSTVVTEGTSSATMLLALP